MPTIKVSLTEYTVVDLCKALEDGSVQVNHDYQRSPRVWPLAARSFLIETILLGYPIPKLYLSQITDAKTKATRREIVDGQQRTMAVKDYFDNKFALVKKALPEEAAGRTFDELDEDLRGQFLEYSLTADLFKGATAEDIREMFRRMNSYTVPLNAEEKRHSGFQGEFKWFIYRMSKKYSQALENIGTFSEKALARMADAKLLAEFCYGVLNGIKLTKTQELNQLYTDNDKSFPEAKQLERRLNGVLDAVIEMAELHDSALMKPYQMYALLLALTHAKTPVAALEEEYGFSPKRPDRDTVIHNLTTLAEVLDDPDSAAKKYKSLIEASTSKTNVEDHRRTRFLWFCRALDNKLQ